MMLFCRRKCHKYAQNTQRCRACHNVLTCHLILEDLIALKVGISSYVEASEDGLGVDPKNSDSFELSLAATAVIRQRARVTDGPVKQLRGVPKAVSCRCCHTEGIAQFVVRAYVRHRVRGHVFCSWRLSLYIYTSMDDLCNCV